MTAREAQSVELEEQPSLGRLVIFEGGYMNPLNVHHGIYDNGGTLDLKS